MAEWVARQPRTWWRQAAALSAPMVFIALLYLKHALDSTDLEAMEDSTIFLVGANDVNSRTLHLYSNDFFERCPSVHQPQYFEDFTPMIKAIPGLNASCINNPSVINLKKNLLLFSLRTYTSKAGFACTSAETEGGQWREGWTGRGGTVLALMRRGGPGQMKLVAEWHAIDHASEDARLFIDDQGKIRMLFNRWRGGDPTMLGMKRNQRRSMHTVEVLVNIKAKTISLQNEQELMYIEQSRDEKNWVPWEGTTKMTYPPFPNFTPHTVLNWQSYDLPIDQTEAAAITPIPFVEKFIEYTGGWIRFSGGTPGIRLDKDRFLAAGHTVGDLSCFHSEHIKNELQKADDPQTRKLLADLLMQKKIERDPANPFHACNSSFTAPKGAGEWQNHFSKNTHALPFHHPRWEYFIFLYTWSAHYPYEVTHISHSFLPDDATDHQGVLFPTGLQKLSGKELLLTYGKDDSRAMAMTLTTDLVNEWLMPLKSLQPENYKFCTVGTGQPLFVMGQRKE